MIKKTLPANVSATEVAMVKAHLPHSGTTPDFTTDRLRTRPLPKDPAAVAALVLERPDVDDVKLLVQSYGVDAAIAGLDRLRGDRKVTPHYVDLASTILGLTIKQLAVDARAIHDGARDMRPEAMVADDLPTRAAEILRWRRTGIYEGTALQLLADRMETAGEPCPDSPIRAAGQRTVTHALQAMAAMPTAKADPSDWLLTQAQDDQPIWDDRSRRRISDWRDHVGEQVQAIWPSLPEGVRIAIARDAQERAEAMEIDPEMD